MVVPLSSLPPSRDGFYAINNQFLANGPKGFTEFKMLENEDMFIRIDLPGVPQDGVRVSIDPTKKAVCICADAPKEHKHDYAPRNYGTVTGLVCKCCEISGFISHMSDGVLRLLLSKSKVPTQTPPSCISFLAGPEHQGCSGGSGIHKFPHGTDPHDPALSGRVLQPHPCVNFGSQMAYEWKQLPNGCLFLCVAMPGVPKDKFIVSVDKGRVMVTGQAPAVSHDSGARFYCGDVAMLTTPLDIPLRMIKTSAKNGVIRLIIPPV